MLEVLRHRWKTFRIISNYTETQKKQLDKLQACYKEIIDSHTENTPIDIDANRLPKTDTTQLYKYIPKKNLDHPLSRFANGILEDIAQYLTRREEQWGQYSNDPINLFCLLLIDKLQEVIYQGMCTKEQKKDLKKWILFIDTILVREIFPDTENNDLTKTLKALLINIKNHVESTIRHIKFELSRATIGQHFRTVTNHGISILTTTFEFLSYVLSDQINPKNFSIINLYNPILDSEVTNLIEKTLLGEYLFMLSHSYYIKELNFPGGEGEEDEGKILTSQQKLLDSLISKQKVISGNKQKDVPDNNNQIFNVPAGIVLSLPDKENEFKIAFIDEKGEPTESVVKSFIIQRTKQAKQTGISSLFSNNEELMRSFVKLLGYLDVFSRVLLNCREAIYLVDSGGEILTANITKVQLLFLVAAYNQIVETIDHEMARIYQVAKKTHSTIFSKKTDEYSKWERNYLDSDILVRGTQSLIKKVIKETTKILSEINNIHRKAKKFKKRLVFFMHEIGMISKDYTWLVPKSDVRSFSNDDYHNQWQSLQNTSVKQMRRAEGNIGLLEQSEHAVKIEEIKEIEGKKLEQSQGGMASTLKKANLTQLNMSSPENDSHGATIVGFAAISAEQFLSIDLKGNVKIWDYKLLCARSIYQEQIFGGHGTIIAAGKLHSDSLFGFVRKPNGLGPLIIGIGNINDLEKYELKKDINLSKDYKVDRACIFENKVVILTSKPVGFFGDSFEYKVLIFEVDDKQTITEYKSFKPDINVNCISIINRHIVFGTSEGIKFMSLEDQILTSSCNAKEFGSVRVITPLTSDLFVCGYEAGLKVWNVKNKECILTHVFEKTGEKYQIFKISETMFAVSFKDNKFKEARLSIWDIKANKAADQPPVLALGTKSFITALFIGFNSQLILGDDQGKIESGFLDILTEKQEIKNRLSLPSVPYSENNSGHWNRHIEQDISSETLEQQAEQWFHKGNLEAALRLLNQAIKQEQQKSTESTKQEEDSSFLYRLLNSRAVVLYGLGALPEAYEDVDKVLRDNPENEKAMQLRKEIFGQLGELSSNFEN